MSKTCWCGWQGKPQRNSQTKKKKKEHSLWFVSKCHTKVIWSIVRDEFLTNKKRKNMKAKDLLIRSARDAVTPSFLGAHFHNSNFLTFVILSSSLSSPRINELSSYSNSRRFVVSSTFDPSLAKTKLYLDCIFEEGVIDNRIPWLLLAFLDIIPGRLRPFGQLTR